MQELIIIMEDSQDFLCSSKFPWAHGRISLKFINNLGVPPQKGSSALLYGLIYYIYSGSYQSTSEV
jgi:hypothetical protein